MAARTFADLVDEASRVEISGWDFSWLNGRATEDRPSWGYQQQLKRRLAQVRSAIDLDTGGGEVLAGAAPFPPTMAATESWPPNLGRAARRLHPLGAVVVSTEPTAALPFADGSFELVTSRHPVAPQWDQIHRLLAPGGAYFAQHVGPASVFELSEFFLGKHSADTYRARHPQTETAAARAAGLEIRDVQCERTRIEIFDIGAVVYLLRKCPWWVPDFSVEKYWDRLQQLHEFIRCEGRFLAHSSRTLFQARKTVN